MPELETMGQTTRRWLLTGLMVLFCSLVWMGTSPVWADESTLELIKPMSFSNGDLRRKDFSHQDLRASDFANANMESTNFSEADLRGGIFSASFMQNTNLQGSNLQDAMLDQVDFTGANLENAVLVEALLLRSTFKATHIAGADFTDAILDGAQRKELCQAATGTNPKTGIDTRFSLECVS